MENFIVNFLYPILVVVIYDLIKRALPKIKENYRYWRGMRCPICGKKKIWDIKYREPVCPHCLNKNKK